MNQPWRKRQEIPDPQIRDAADQYEAARELLSRQPPGSGVMLPLINSAAVAVELYLKCLSAELVYRPDDLFPEDSRVYAAPAQKGHLLAALFNTIPDDIRADLERAYNADLLPLCGTNLLGLLERYEGAFAASRYPFEEEMDISKYELASLMRLSEFLRKYVATRPSIERIEWK